LSPDGLQYGITSAGDDSTTGNTPVMTSPLIDNSVVFTLGLPTGFTLGGVTNVSFQYGTDLSEPNVPGIAAEPVLAPEPSTFLLLGIGIGLLGLGIAATKTGRSLMYSRSGSTRQSRVWTQEKMGPHRLAFAARIQNEPVGDQRTSG
jgi:hypothetical protein